ncbi:hypothetical protein [Caldimonas thermodepolymerans]|uniref:Uncharacterized protein n=1 Tax=Caldimonas thermodepolymerans TaxID=215580 RepID=A0AA46HWI3_9BURK|nr:hypothetical protein [Caldimonas thermodepolymerans]TCP08397.1 hypothetical protein EV676_103430 [Caldimonas thermodepolymerans]UZG48491.1 hypothetical protein ONS87_02425 [Caldimonas thermodepolymerans]
MSKDVTVTIAHVRAAGLCVHGTRTWFARQGLDFRDFLAQGLPASVLLTTGDAMARRVVEVAQACHEEPR